MVITNTSSKGIYVGFSNGLELSVQWNPMNYCAEGTVEIAIFKDDDFYTPESVFGKNPSDKVMGYVPVTDLPSIIENVRAL